MTPISQLIKIVRETVRVKDPANAHVIEAQLDDILWKIRSGRSKDLDASDTMIFKELINTYGTKPTTAGGQEVLEGRQEPAQREATGSAD